MSGPSVEPQVFPRGSAVLAYWLTHAEGMRVDPLGAVVERILPPAPLDAPEALVVRMPGSRRERTIPVRAIAGVEPATGRLLLAVEQRPHLTTRAVAWTGPRATRGARVATTLGVRGARRFGAAVAWFAPRFARATRDGAVLALRGGLWSGRHAVRASRRLAAAKRTRTVRTWFVRNAPIIPTGSNDEGL